MYKRQIGIIGGTGSSKTSLVQLIPRLYDVTQGTVKVGGVDVRDYDIEALRNSVSMVLQKNVLFSGTIKENLRWGDADASDEELVRICKLACADEFIQRLPEKYETHIEQGGTNVAYVNWDGDITVDESAKTVGMSYRVAAIQLADETGDGLKLSTGNTAGVDAALDALVTDYGTHAGNITFDGGRITIGSGTVDEKANTYTGTTNVRSNSTVTLAKDGAFGRTDLLNISNGQVNFNGKSETLGSINVGLSLIHI